jgi:P27 family predicted phage terminase small subunit
MAKKPGRPKKPTAQLKLAGTFRKDRRNDDEPMPDVVIPDVPEFLEGEALKEWNRIAPLLAKRKCLTEWDRSMLAMYCQEWGKYVRLNTEFNSDVAMVNMLSESTKLLKNIKTIATEFGLTPSSRTNLSMGKADTNNPFEALMKKKQA